MPTLAISFPSTSTFHCAHETDTELLAHAFAQFLTGVQLPFYWCLVGDLGSGKTALMRYLLRALGVSGTVKSPTYTLLETYDTNLGKVHHFDLYRLQSPNEWTESGFAETVQEQALVAIEWHEKGGDLLPPVDLRIECAYDESGEGRKYRFLPLNVKTKKYFNEH